MNKELFKRTENTLYDYKTLKSEVENLKLCIEEVEKEFHGCSAITYKESTAPTNKFNSVVENEVIQKEKKIEKLQNELAFKERLLVKIDNGLRSLKDRDYEIIELKYFRQIKTWEDIGAAMQLSGGHCRDLNKRIVKSLSKIIFIDKYAENL